MADADDADLADFESNESKASKASKLDLGRAAKPVRQSTTAGATREKAVLLLGTVGPVGHQ